jgi:hypothetical protein
VYQMTRSLTTDDLQTILLQLVVDDDLKGLAFVSFFVFVRVSLGGVIIWQRGRRHAAAAGMQLASWGAAVGRGAHGVYKCYD